MTQAAILLVDDEKTILESLKGQLRGMFGARFVYEAAENVPEAWEVLEELSADGLRVVVIVSDWLMPEIRGDEFLVEVRQHFPDTARIMLTGHADAGAIKRALEEAEVLSVLHKPWSETDLRRLIETATT